MGDTVPILLTQRITQFIQGDRTKSLKSLRVILTFVKKKKKLLGSPSEISDSVDVGWAKNLPCQDISQILLHFELHLYRAEV